MATVRPLHAIRYNVERYPNLAPVLAPPYDIISADGQQELYDRDPHNVIRLEYGKQSATDTDIDNRYTRARDALAAWLADGSLVMEEAACVYPHRQGYTWEGKSFTRNGFFAAVELQPFDAGDVLPHELTLKGPKEDRLKLMRACLTSFSPVLGLYDGRETPLGDLLGRVTAGTPLAVAEGCGFDETLWRGSDTAINREIVQAMAQRKILIADGHHRYETMLALRDLLRQEFPDTPANAAFNYGFMLLIDLNDPGLLVLPTHRLLQLTPEMKAVFCRLAGNKFRLEKIEISHPDQITAILTAHAAEHAFIWYDGSGYTLLTSKRSSVNGLPTLDVVALQERIIAPLLAMDPEGEATVERNVRYTPKNAEAIAAVDRGQVDGALFLNPTPVHDVLTLAEHGVRCPQKSTYFYPKAPTGLVMHSLRPDVTVG
ncbi:MAG: DUF1015 domain-containing protein [Armatimonadota bacterium]